MSKFLFVTGGVMSGVGKGIASASIGKLLQAKGFTVSAIKIDPYINIDAGTMNPTEHGEVFVTDDGDETDQDIGNYERFLDTNITSANYMTTGRVYLSVIERERNLEYKGRCVEVVPDIPEEVVRRIRAAAELNKTDIMIVEVGGTVGEYQNILFLEAARMMQVKAPQDVAFVLVSYLPVPGALGEMKTKPTQYAIRTLNASGIQPDFVIARSTMSLDAPRKNKIARVASIDPKRVVSAPDVGNIYDVPLNFHKEGLDDEIIERFSLEPRESDLTEWETFTNRIKVAKDEINIGIVGKYFQTGQFTLSDSYISVIEAVKHACWNAGKKPNIRWLNAESYEQNDKAVKELSDFHAVIVPGGYGSRGIEGKIKAIQYVREQKIPYLGLCYGMQMAAVEFARHIAGLEGANTKEINPDAVHPIIHTMEGQVDLIKEKKYGGTMRLGAYACELKEGSLAHQSYGSMSISERHRHRYEFNNDYKDQLESAGLVFSGTCPDNGLVEIIELPQEQHPFFVGVQFHPEFLSRPLTGHPLFNKLIKVAISR